MGNTQGLIAKFSEFVSKEYNDKQLTSYYIIHQETLSVESVALNDFLKDENRIILYIRALHLWKLRETTVDIFYRTAVSWLFQGKASGCVLQLKQTKQTNKRNKIRAFAKSRAFLVDFLFHVNKEIMEQYASCTKKYRIFTNIFSLKIIFSRVIFSILHNLLLSSQLLNSGRKHSDFLFSGAFDTVLQNFADRF